MSSEEDDFDAAPDGAPRNSSVSEELRRLYANTKDIFSPQAKKDSLSDSLQESMKEAPHPGTEGVSFEEALKKCPHLAEQYKQAGENAQNGECSHAQQTGEVSRCPYQNDASQEWPMRAVLMFLSYNFISAGVNIEIIKAGFVAAAYHMGMLRISEFVTLYLATASMSSYKMLGLLLMITNKGGPVFSFSKQYHVTARNIVYGLVISISSLLASGLSMSFASYMEYFKTEIQSDNVFFSPWDHILIPLASEFVYRGFLMKEMGRDLGAWFGIIGSSGWFCILQKGQASAKFAAFVQGLLWSMCTMALQGELVPTTMAHVSMACLRSLFPSIYFTFWPNH